jgi:hypothetical protein
MQARRENDKVLVTLGAFESYILRKILGFLRNSYQKKPLELDGETSAAWYHLREPSPLTEEEKADWLQQLHEYKKASVGLLNRWIEALTSEALVTPVEMILPVNEIPDFVTVINDYRLVSALRNHIGQAEMDVRTQAEFDALPAPQQTALKEICFLAWLIESLLHLISEEPPDFPEQDSASTK